MVIETIQIRLCANIQLSNQRILSFFFVSIGRQPFRRVGLER